MSKSVEDILEHFGVKGMRWGVRKERRAERKAEKQVAKADSKWTRNQISLKNMIGVMNEAARRGEVDIERINAKPEYAGANFRRPSALRAKYYEEHRSAYERNLNAVAAERGNTSASGRYKLDIVVESVDSFPSFYITDTSLNHAAIPEEAVLLDVVFDDNGHLLRFNQMMSDMAQSTLTGQEFLEHYGVKGMKWGVRKKRKSGSPADDELAKLSTPELRDLISRLQLEQQYRSMKKSSSGSNYVSQLLANAGKTASGVVVSSVTAFAVKKALESVKG